jgi:hypothetical protein
MCTQHPGQPPKTELIVPLFTGHLVFRALCGLHNHAIESHRT